VELPKLFSGLANAVLELALPTVLDWFRERVGPSANVARITADGAWVHLDGVDIPLGPRGRLFLERATLRINGKLGLPEARLHAFHGNIVFGDPPELTADVVFEASEVPEEDAWISGDLRFERATWRPRPGLDVPNPMRGGAKLYVSSTTWRLEEGHLDGNIVRARFHGAGDLEAQEGLPAATGALVLEHGRVGPFFDAMVALLGRSLPIPSWIPLDAELDGRALVRSTRPLDVRCDVRVAARSLEGRLQGALEDDRLDADLSGTVRLAALLASHVPHAALPAEEDVATLRFSARGAPARPEVSGTVRIEELGFRFGRPRFVPKTVVRGIEADLFVRDDRASVQLRAPDISGTADVPLRERSALRVAVRASRGAPFLREMLRTLDIALHVPDDAALDVDAALSPDGLDGTVALGVGTSRIVADLRRGRAEGWIEAADLVAMDVLRGGVQVVRGRIAVRLSLSLEGDLSAPELGLRIGDRDHTLRNASARFSLAGAFRYEDLIFEAHDAHFRGRGEIPFEGAAQAPYLALDVDPLGPSIAEAFGVSLPFALRGRGSLAIHSEGHLVVMLDLGWAAVETDLFVRGDGVRWRDARIAIGDGGVTSSGLARNDGSFVTRLELRLVDLANLPAIAGETPGHYVRGRASGTIVARGRTEAPIAIGELCVYDATFPVLNRVPSKWGVRPPNERATAPVYATLVLTERGIALKDIAVALPGARLEGEAILSYSRLVDAALLLVLDETYLRTSRIFALPRAIARQVVLPIRIQGAAEAPRARVAVRDALRRLSLDNRLFKRAIDVAEPRVGLPEVDAHAIEAELRRELS
jgi:hypothetical protein